MVTGILVWLMIGSLIWMLLDGLGIVGAAFARRNSSAASMVLATLLAIVAWPVFARYVMKNPRKVAALLARNLWGRPE